ncbi:hypothetical protein [Streptomyces sp. NPDC090298]|uniref:hypothetical protein n=1 Tax=Streptomyces sp. NPDC090298 TaxID=3365959 RepID=UPI003819B1DF
MSATALTTALAVAFTNNQLPRTTEVMAPVAALADVPENPPFDFDAAARVRLDQCLLNLTLRRGGQELKALSRSGLNGTEAELHAAAESAEWYNRNTPLAIAWEKDREWNNAKGVELADRVDAWERSLIIPPATTPPGYTVAGFEWVADEDDPFDTTGVSAGLGALYLDSLSDIYLTDQTPVASKESVDAVNAIAAARYSEDRHEDWPAVDALKWEMTWTHPMYADDARLFLQYGGFPTTAPEPDSMEFRLDVEALKARFASCTTRNPIDPYKVLGAEVAQASVEWQNELSGQKAQRSVIMDAEAKASRHLGVVSQAMAEALGQSLIASRLTDWQAHWIRQSPSTSFYPTAAEFAEVKTNIARARERAQGRVLVAGRAALAAQEEAARADEAKAEAYALADAAGLPRGRGLMYGQQAIQVAKASAAAAQAAFKATETAANATRASATDSKALLALAETQAHAAKTEFRRKAAEEAEAQAKAAAQGAAYQAKLAADQAAKAKEAENRAKAAEAEAKTAAADAAAKRKKAETESAYAKSQKELADTERAKAADANARAKTERQTAADQLAAAQAAGETATSKKDAAVAAELKASRARDDAREAELRRDSLDAKADAAEALLAAVDGTDAATGARDAATKARTAANAASAAAVSARAAASESTAAATNAREAATRAQGAAKRAQALADSAKRDVAVTEAAVQTAHAATADAIDAAAAAKGNAAVAKTQAETAQLNAREATSHAAVARSEAVLAGKAAARAAGFAYATAQAAKEAGDSAQKVIKPANDAIELGAPYQDTDTSAGLAVLTGQAAKTAAAQQVALAKAKAEQAAAAAKLAQKVAAEASADAKAAAEAAAEAAVAGAQALASAEAAQKSSSAADASVKAAQQSEKNTVKYHEAAVKDAAAAQSSADTAAGYADQADAAATEAEKDAASARVAATEAEGDAASARDTAARAEADAAAAEEAAAGARESAEEAQGAADRTETSGSNEQISQGVTTGIGGVWAVLDHIEYIGEPQNVVKDNCNPIIHVGDCRITATVTYKSHVDLFMCLAAPDSYTGNCPRVDTVYLGPDVSDAKSDRMSITLTMAQFNSGIDPVDILLGDFIGCAKLITPGVSGGSWGDCAWAASWFVAGALFKTAKTAVTAMDAALKTGIGFTDAWLALRSVGLSEVAVQGMVSRIVRKLNDTCNVVDRATPRGGSFGMTAFRVSTAAASAGNTGPGCWIGGLNGPGFWAAENEGMNAAAAAYQARVTGGVPQGFVYKVKMKYQVPGRVNEYVKLDGYQNGKLIDAKYWSDSGVIDPVTGKFKFFMTGPIKTAKAQVAGAKSAVDDTYTPIVYYVSSPEGATAFQHMVDDTPELVGRIEVIYMP